MSILKQRLHVTIRGAVQGVGFRPFIYRLATELGLVGWVNNSAQGVFVEVEGTQAQLQNFLLRIEQQKPPRSIIQSLESKFLAPVGYQQFEIHASTGGAKTATILPDLATCSDCLREIFNKSDRRYGYPFTNCTNCGPRFSIVEALPYDRANTTMKKFQMCIRCQSEYENLLDRRFHAQPNACPECGPHLELWERDGNVLALHHQALIQAAASICQGKIIAIKGLGGFHLVVDARNEAAVQKLRRCKRREAKPFALMYPSLELIQADCEVSDLEAKLLRSPQAPIVLLQGKLASHAIAPSVAPGNPYLGVMLPYTPLHHLLMAELGFPIVATSGNLTDEPICIDEKEALQRLSSIAEVFLVHNRPIARPVDDSVVRVMMGREMVLRRARGYAPLPCTVLFPDSRLLYGRVYQKTSLLAEISGEPAPTILDSLLAVGAHLKNTIALCVKEQVFVSQHIGDLETVPALNAFERAIADFQQLYQTKPVAIACDLHPDYLSTQFARNSGIPAIPVQHHYAHVLSCMAENNLIGMHDSKPVLGIAWDGTGYGLDGTIWGGEFLLVNSWRSSTSDRETPFERVAYLQTFRLPGGEKAIKEPRRVAIGLLYELLGEDLFEMKHLAPVKAFSDRDLGILQTMLQRNLNTSVTSSIGRLFDAIASIVGLRQQNQFEGQAAMELEFAIAGFDTDECYSFEILATSSPAIVNLLQMLREILADIRCGLPLGKISAKFHNTLVEIVVAVAKSVGEEKIILTGGCFQNKYLTERAIKRLQAENFCPYWHQRVPPNDGGIALGQIVAATFHLSNRKQHPCV
ncbi:MAG: Carbamoyltransferase HypF [Chroococcidiopsis sp. SAG 2025]|uniref:carbamoyltransferase HypF n=1 Tax=Chroococcidiopsis sp. SAG 2025 TaxID=171389 RepID=UPI0029370307|nr:carbamoyltransferase HypF [Chroococcidiopsis sp. SAG 2025]MDV2995264.1 Carbamoyltransferase HypF [Chroococcidiopsis sp. SAG 2025]